MKAVLRFFRRLFGSTKLNLAVIEEKGAAFARLAKAEEAKLVLEGKTIALKAAHAAKQVELDVLESVSAELHKGADALDERIAKIAAAL